MAIKAQPITSGSKYIDPSMQTGLTHVGIRHFNQWQAAINSIPISVSGENVAGAGEHWTLTQTPSANVSLVGILGSGPVPLVKGEGNAWNYTIDGKEITTAQAYQAVIASYEYQQ